MSSTFVSRFTPSLMTPETLEALFIQREKLAEELIAEIRHSATSGAKHHSLLIAPRGLGKTHLISIVYNRVTAQDDLSKKLRVAWLREEERGVTSFLELLMRILMALARQYPDDGLTLRVQELYDLSRKEGERAAADLLTEYVGKCTLLLIVENLDSIFSGLKESGRQALRAYLQEHPICTILATATSLFNGVSLQTSAFYGFFHVHHLEELSLEDAVSLLARIAELRGDSELAAFIRTPVGRSRIRAVRHLAGGNHRVYVIFSEFLTRSSLDELVDPFMRMLDDLTPYYQGRMDLLSPQQQQIVEYLAHSEAAQTVKDIARRCFMSQQTAANHLKDLKEKGYLLSITPQRDKRETYYELREPLMRLCFEVKEYRGGPIRLFVDFLRNWYPRDELIHRLETMPSEADIERSCLLEALERMEKDSDDPRISACMEDLNKCMAQHDSSGALQVAEELAHVRSTKQDWCGYGYFLLNAGRDSEALQAFDKALKIDMQYLQAMIGRGATLTLLNSDHEALATLDLAGEPSDEVNARLYWFYRARAQFGLELYEESLISMDRLLELDSAYDVSWLARGKTLFQLKRYEAALECFQKAYSLASNKGEALIHEIYALFELGRHKDASMRADELLSHLNSEEDMMVGSVLMQLLKRYDIGMALLDRVLALDGTNAKAWARRGDMLLHDLRFSEALRAFAKALALKDDEANKELLTYPTHSISIIKTDAVNPTDRERWLKDWQRLAKNREQFKPTLRMLEAAVTYLNTGDDRALLALPLEMREIVKEQLSE